MIGTSITRVKSFFFRKRLLIICENLPFRNPRRFRETLFLLSKLYEKTKRNAIRDWGRFIFAMLKNKKESFVVNTNLIIK